MEISRKKGFTAVEIVMTMVVISIIGAGINVFLMTGWKSYALIVNRNRVTDQARYAINRMAREMVTVSTISTASSGTLAFQDTDGNSTDFHLTGSILYRGSNVLAKEVSSLAFTYYDNTGATTTTASEVRRIKMELTVTASGETGGSVTLRTEVYPRSFMYTSFQ